MSDKKDTTSQRTEKAIVQRNQSDDSGIESKDKVTPSSSYTSLTKDMSSQLTHYSYADSSEQSITNTESEYSLGTSETTVDNTEDLNTSSSSSFNLNKSSTSTSSESSSNAPSKRLTKNVQSFLHATLVARNYVNVISSNQRNQRLKRLATRKQSKSSELRCKFETKNVILKNMMANYAQTAFNAAAASITSPTKVSKMNAFKLKTLFSKFECYFTTVYLPATENFNIDQYRYKNDYHESSRESHITLRNNISQIQLPSLKFDFQFNSKSFIETEGGDGKTTEVKPLSDPPVQIYKQNPSEFFTCPLCAHCLLEPITLVCGCTFCKNCLKEYISFRMDLDAKTNLNLLKSESHNSTTEDAINNNNTASYTSKSFECYNCGKGHKMNSFDQFKTNTIVSLLVEKLWAPNVEIKNLRNDIRKLVVFELENSSSFQLEKYEYLLQQAYEKDKSNNLILVDLFLINHFSGFFEKSNKYADQVIKLKPNWIMGYFLKSINNEIMENYIELKVNLNMCLKLEPNLLQPKLRLDKIDDQLWQTRTRVPLKTNRRLNQLRLQKRHDSLIDTKEANLNTGTRLKKTFRKINSLDIDFEHTSVFKPAIESSGSPHKRSKICSTEDMVTKNESKTTPLETSVSSWTNSFELNEEDELNSTSNSTASSSSNFNTMDETIDRTLFYIDPMLVISSDVDCSLCYRLLYKPVTTPCGHSYCSSCLDRSLDHQDKCPLCKSSLDEYLAERRAFTTVFLERLIKAVFISESLERESQYNEEQKELTNDENEVPIFVCTLAFPFAPCPLHIYEPRYRLMLRRAIESGSNRFGMCMYGEQTSYHFTEYGCILDIRNYQFTRDGRAIVATVGGRRFRVIKVIHRDGYYVAKVVWVSDKRVEDEEGKKELQTLHDEVYALSIKWYSFMPALQKQKIREIYGISEMPAPEVDIQANDNGPVWHWFLLNILPLDNDFQYRFLTKVSLTERLKQIKRIVLVLMTPVQRSLYTSASENDIDRDDSESSRQILPQSSSENNVGNYNDS